MRTFTEVWTELEKTGDVEDLKTLSSIEEKVLFLAMKDVARTFFDIGIRTAQEEKAPE